MYFARKEPEDFWIYRTDVLNAVYFRQGLPCTVGLTNNLIDGGQPRVKNGFQNMIWLRFTYMGFSPWLGHWLTQEYMLDLA